MLTLDDSKKIFSSFYIIGCNYSNLQIYKENNNKESITQYLQNIDLLITDFFPNENIIRKNNEKWLKIIKNSNVWFRIHYSKQYDNPITELKIIECNHDQKHILFPKKYIEKGYRPIVITKILKNENIKEHNLNTNLIPISKECINFSHFNQNFVKISINCNAKEYLKIPSKKSCVVLAVTRTNTILPLKDIYIKPNTKNNLYQFYFYHYQSIYSYKYMPKILDSYPPEEESNSSIALFCFPEGIKITEQYSMPKWFNFVLTDQLGERTYGTILYFKEDLDKKNIFINNFHPFYIEKNKSRFIEKGICILSKYPFYYNSKLFLKELYRIAFGNGTKIPLERIICNFVDSLYIDSLDKIIRYKLNELTLDFYQISYYGVDLDTNNNYFDLLFRILNFDLIIAAWKCLLLERKLILLCSSKSTLHQVANGLINLLFPFIWNHVFIPILPEKMKLFIESPVPSLIGISFPIEIREIPNDCIILNIDKNCLENYNNENSLPELPSKFKSMLDKSLLRIKEKYLDDYPINIKEYIDYQDEAFPHYELEKIPKIDDLEIRDAFYNIFIYIFKNYEKFFIWKNKKKYINEIKEDENENPIIFLKDAFLKSNDALDNEFLSLFQETGLFTQFINCFNPGQEGVQKSMVVFLESIKNGRGKNKLYFQNIKLEKIDLSPKIHIEDLNGKLFFYLGFQKLDRNLFIHYKAPKIPYKSKFVFYKDEWCYDLKKLKKKDWPKYFFFIINDIWFTFFSYVLNFYEDNQAIILMDYALSLIEDIIIKKKIPPTRNIFSKIIKSLGRNILTPFMTQILKIVNQVYKNNGNNSLFQNDYLNGLYAISSKEGFNSILSINNPGIKHVRAKSDVMLSPGMYKKKISNCNKEIESYIRKIIFLTSDICPNCFLNRQVTKKISPEEFLSGFYYNFEFNNMQDYKESNYILCINCQTRFQPKIYYLERNQNNVKPKEINILSPMNLYKEIDKIFSEKGENIFYNGINDIDNNIYLNIIFYFELFDLPLCVLYIQNDMDKFEKIKDQLKINLGRKKILKKRSKKDNYFDTFTQDDFNLEITKKLNECNIINNNINYSNSTKNIKVMKEEFNYIFEEEKNLWKNIQYKILENKNINNDNIDENKIDIEDKSDIINFTKEIKEYINDSLSYFIKDSQLKLYKFLINYEKKKQINAINIAISDELKYHNENKIENIENKKRLLSPDITRNKKMFSYDNI